jgi:hypothetical protein
MDLVGGVERLLEGRERHVDGLRVAVGLAAGVARAEDPDHLEPDAVDLDRVADRLLAVREQDLDHARADHRDLALVLDVHPVEQAAALEQHRLDGEDLGMVAHDRERATCLGGAPSRRRASRPSAARRASDFGDRWRSWRRL